MGEARDPVALGELRTDLLLRGKLWLEQPSSGHRAGTDAILLAAMAEPRPGDVFADVGAGVGTVGLAVALRQPDCRGMLIERDPVLAAIARRNVEANGLTDRVGVICLDVFDREALAEARLLGVATLVLTNPPFFLADAVRASPDPVRAKAHVLPSGSGHADWLRRCHALASPKARIGMIHRADVLAELLAGLQRLHAAPLLKIVHSHDGGVATRVLLGGTLGSRAPLAILPPLTLHEAQGAFTAETERLNAGEPLAFWPKKKPARRPASDG